MASAGPAPAFSSSKGAAAFLGLIAFVLLLPVLISVTGIRKRERAYSAIPSTKGNSYFGYFQKTIFEEKGDIDILFTGSSLVNTAIDAPFLADALAQSLGRTVSVRVLAYTFPGDDARYVALKDLLARRHVKMVVITPSLPWGFAVEQPHPWAKYWFDPLYHREILEGIPLSLQAAYYGEAVLGAPRHVLSAIRPDFPPSGDLESTLGADLLHWGINGSRFVPFYPPPPSFTPEELTHYWHAPDSKISPVFPFIFPLTHRLLTLTASLVHSSGARLVALNFPYTHYGDRIVEAADWSPLLGKDTPLIGMTPDRIFNGISDQDFMKFYFDREAAVALPQNSTSRSNSSLHTGHWNVNGARFYTQTILPAIAKQYELACQAN